MSSAQAGSGRRGICCGGTAIALALGWATMPALAHHSNAPFYSPTKKVETQGKITKFVFMNPHAFLHLDGPDETGKVVDWQIELGAPISLRRTGLDAGHAEDRHGDQGRRVALARRGHARHVLRADDAARRQSGDAGRARAGRNRPEVSGFSLSR